MKPLWNSRLGCPLLICLPKMSFGVKVGKASRITSHRSLMVRAAAFRRNALSLEKAFSIGLKSGE
jgi:hypothetical protein